MLDMKELSMATPEEELKALAGSQIFTIHVGDFVTTRVVETCKVRSADKKTGQVVIIFEDGSMVWFQDPVTIRYDAEGNLR